MVLQPLAVKLSTLRLSSLSFLPYLRHSSAAVSLLCLTGSVMGLYQDRTEEEDEKFKKGKDWRSANSSLKQTKIGRWKINHKSKFNQEVKQGRKAGRNTQTKNIEEVQ